MTQSDILEQIEKSLDLYDRTRNSEHLEDVSRWLEFERKGT